MPGGRFSLPAGSVRWADDRAESRSLAVARSEESVMQDEPVHAPVVAGVRRAIPDDAEALAGLIGQLAAHHGDRATTDADHLRADLFASPPWATALVAEDTEKLIGYALLVRLYHAQFAARALDLHHLFVVPEARSSGVGRALVQAARAEAEAQGCARLMVGTHPDNYRAQSFYRTLGFVDRPPGGAQFELPLGGDRCGAREPS
jgi:GNAT superfamily N-acetyltransferase